MALSPGAKSAFVKPLPPWLPRNVPKWIELVTRRRLYPWQREVLRDLSKPKRPRVGYVQVARKNGKTFLGACLALAEACRPEGQRHVYAVSDSERNLNAVVMRELRDLVGGSEHLRDSIHIFQNHLEVPETGSFIQTRPNRFSSSQGINPHLVLFDEVHLQTNPDVWSGMQMAGAARADALLFGITTPGYDMTGLANGLYQQVKAGEDIYGRIFEADTGLDIDDRRGWRAANPCYRLPGFSKAMEFDRAHLPEHEFRRFRLGQWTATEAAWLPYGVWDSLERSDWCMMAGERMWLGFDGSYSGDSTALVGCTADGHLFIVDCWENPGRPGWRVPRDEVEATVEAAFDQWDVAELVCDPPYWEREIGDWSKRWPGRVVEFPTFSRARMGPACTAFYSAVMERTISHDGDPRMARHLGNCVVKQTPAGDVITKVDKDSPQKIDLAVAAVIAYDAMRQASPPQPDFWVGDL